MGPVPKYPLDTAAKLALIRAAGRYYDTKTRCLLDAEKQPVWAIYARMSEHPLNWAFHYFIKNNGKKADWGTVGGRYSRAIGASMQDTLDKVTAKVFARAFTITDPRAVYGAT